MCSIVCRKTIASRGSLKFSTRSRSKRRLARAVAEPGVLVGLGVGVDADHLGGGSRRAPPSRSPRRRRGRRPSCPRPARRSTRRRRGGAGTSSSPRERRAASARRSAPAAARPRAGRAARTVVRRSSGSALVRYLSPRMPASPTATAEQIKDVNTRYHDVAADSYDAKWGIDFGDDRPGPGARASCARPSAARARAVRRRARDRRRHRLLLAQPRASRPDRATRPRPTSRPGCSPRCRERRGPLGVEVETVGTEAETLPFADESFDLVLGHAVLHHIPDLDRAFAEFLRVLRPGRHDRLLRRALALRRPARGAAEARRRGRRRRSGGARFGASAATRPTATAERRPRARGRGRRPRLRARRAAIGDRRRRLRARSGSAARSCSPTSTAGCCARSSRPPSRPRSHGPGATSPSAATSPCRRSTRGCSSRACPPELFYNLVLSARNPGSRQAPPEAVRPGGDQRRRRPAGPQRRSARRRFGGRLGPASLGSRTPSASPTSSSSEAASPGSESGSGSCLSPGAEAAAAKQPDLRPRSPSGAWRPRRTTGSAR